MLLRRTTKLIKECTSIYINVLLLFIIIRGFFFYLSALELKYFVFVWLSNFVTIFDLSGNFVTIFDLSGNFVTIFDVSGKEPHRRVGVSRDMLSGSFCGEMVGKLARNANS